MNIAVVDIGTNSTRLLIAEVSAGREVRVLKTGLITTRLGEGIGKQAYLLRPAVDRTVEALLNFRQIILESGAEDVITAATSAVRDAANQRDFLAEVKQRVGWDVRVLPGDEEAQLSYLGVVRGLKADLCDGVVIDIGGGSTEFIWTGSGVLNCASLKIGAVRMTENGSRLADIREMLAGSLIPIKASGARRLVGVGGTLTTLAAVDQEMEIYDPAKVHGYFVTRQGIQDILYRFEKMTLEERKRAPGLQPQRADIITAGVRIALAVVDGLGTDGITVSETDIMYGLLYQALEKRK
ncbi:MAG: Ppx/GppA phosphatase family protein [Eubacteriales bacterium]